MIDAHQHFWRIGRGDYGWLTPALAPIYRDFGPTDLAPILARHDIAQTILVQAAPTEAETAWLLDIAGNVSWVAGVVGWTDFEARDVDERIARLATYDKLVGLRPMVQDLEDDRWLARAELGPAFEAMIRHGLALDALVLTRHLPSLAVCLQRHPALRVVVDHAAKPGIRDRDHASWRAALDVVAAHPQVHCKLSGLVTEAAPDAADDDFARYIDTLLELFGPQRLIWGSDWPVVNLAGGYDRWRSISDRALAHLDVQEQMDVLGGNADRFYLGSKSAE